MDKLLLIDGNSLTYRAYFGSAFSPQGILTNADGIPINAVLTLNSMLNKAIRNYEPTHVFVAFDAGKVTERHSKLESYKAGRKKTPAELLQQMPIVKEMIAKMGINHYEIPGIEADDIIGTLATIYRKDLEVLVLSSDKDLLQLVQENVSVILPQNGAKPDKFVTIGDFYDLYGYNPSQVVDIKGLVGDASDNLPGVKGIGEKGAVKLLTQCLTLEGVYDKMSEHTPKIQEKLQASKDMAFLCKDLATLVVDLELPYTLDSLAFGNVITPGLMGFFKDYGLKSLIRRFENEVTEIDKLDDTQQTFDKIIF